MPIKGSKFCHFVYASQSRMIEVVDGFPKQSEGHDLSIRHVSDLTQIT